MQWRPQAPCPAWMEAPVASQRIVLASPWKLGLFVFVLVAGCGFGLIYAYLTLFGGSLAFEDERQLQAFYGVSGGVALLGILGYLAVISSARPLDRVVRGGKRRDKLMKQLESVEDPTTVDLSDFDDEPALALVLERWSRDHSEVHEAKLAVVQQKEVLSTLTHRIRDAAEQGTRMEAGELTPDLVRLVEALNLYADGRAAESAPAGPSVPSLGDALTRMAQLPQDLDGFCETLAEASQGLSLAAGQGNAGAPSGAGQKLANIRGTLELLAEEANKLSLTAAVQVSRLNEPNGELLEVAEQIRTLSSQYQRLVVDLRQVEGELGDGPAVDEGAGPGMAEWAEQLGFGAEALGECSDRLRRELDRLRAEAGMEPLPAAGEAPRRPVGDFGSLEQPAAGGAPAAPDAPQPEVAAGLADEPAADDGEEPAVELTEFGAREVDDEERVYELAEFGAVEI